MIPSPLPRWTFDVNSSSSDICGHDHFDHAAFKRAQYLNLMGSSEEGSTVRIRVAHESTLKNQLETWNAGTTPLIESRSIAQHTRKRRL